MTWGGILENLVADFAFVVLITPLFATIVLAFTRWRPHAKLIRFLGCTPESKLVVVYFSNLNIQRGGAGDFRGQSRTYSGSAVPESEYALIQTISGAVEAPVNDWVSRLFSGLVDKVPGRAIKQWLGPFRVEVQYKLSPLATPATAPKAVTICLGSAGYNSMTDHYARTLQPLMWFSLDIPKELMQAEGPPIVHDGDIGLLHRLTVERGHVAYIAAGLGVNGTRGALRFLFSNWESLQRTYGEMDFAVALAFPWVSDDPTGRRPPIEIAELSR
ncbi:MAG: hypothetical protein WD939_00355 [Dehalococcoidia bacterium]